MAIRFRFYVFEENGSLKRIPREVADRLPFGEETIPEYAGTVQKVVQVVVENEDGKPVRILDATGSIWHFDKDGSIVDSLHKSLRAVMMADAQAKKQPGKVVDLRPDIKRKRLLEPYRWDVTAEDLDRIAADLWPGLAKANEVRTVKGSLKKIPPLTREGREAIDKLHSAVANMTNCLQGLSEAALKGLVYEADHLAAAYEDGRPFWQAITTEAQKYKDIRTQHRTGKGPFVAVLRLWKEVDKYEVREVDTIALRCKNKASAIEAARRLLAENAHRFDDGVSVEAEVLASLEWEAESDEEVAEA